MIFFFEKKKKKMRRNNSLVQAPIIRPSIHRYNSSHLETAGKPIGKKLKALEKLS
jgi:hypothetical protein